MRIEGKLLKHKIPSTTMRWSSRALGVRDSWNFKYLEIFGILRLHIGLLSNVGPVTRFIAICVIFGTSAIITFAYFALALFSTLQLFTFWTIRYSTSGRRIHAAVIALPIKTAIYGLRAMLVQYSLKRTFLCKERGRISMSSKGPCR